MGFFTWEHYKQGLTMAIGSIVICAIMFQDNVKYEITFVAPALSLVLWSSLSPAYSGMATLLFPLLAFGMIFSLGAYCIVIYGTYAATGSDFSPHTEKAVALVAIATTVMGLLQLIRVRIPALDLSAWVAQFIAGTIVVLSYWGSSLPTSDKVWQMVVVIFIPVFVGMIVSTFIVPNPAGRYSLVLLGQLLDTTAELQNQVVENLLLAEVDEKTGKIDVGGSGISSTKEGEKEKEEDNGVENTINITNPMQEGRYIGIASALEPLVIPIHRLDIKAWKIAAGINGLLTLSALEIDVYSRPRIFPRQEFKAVLTPVRALQHIYTIIVTFMQCGEVRMRSFPLLKNELEEVRAAVELNCQKLKQVIVDGATYEEALMECVPKLNAACAALKSKFLIENEGGNGGSSITNSGVSAEEFVVARELGSIVLLAERQLRRTWEAVPALIAAKQPEAAAAAKSYFATAPSAAAAAKSYFATAPSAAAADKSSSSSTTTSGGAVFNEVLIESGTTEVPSKVLQAVPAAASLSPPPPPPMPMPSQQQQPQATVAPREILKATPTCNPLRLYFYNLSLRTGIHAWHLKIIFQVTFIFLVSALFNVLPAVQAALHKKAYWVIITIFAISDTTSGGIVDNGAQRILGTFIGSVGIAITAALAYLANGSSYTGSTVAQKITYTLVVSLWISIMKMFNCKYSPRWMKLFTVATLLVPLIALLDSSGEDVWFEILWRIVCTCLGVALMSFASIALFPVTVDDHIVEKTGDCLLHIATMLDGISTLKLGLDPDTTTDSNTTLESKMSGDPSKGGNGGCLGRFKGRKGKDTATDSTKAGDPSEEDVEAAAAALENAPSKVPSSSDTKNTEAAGNQPQHQEDAASVAARAIIADEIQSADAKLFEIIKLRDIVDKEYFASKVYYKAVTNVKSHHTKGQIGSVEGEQHQKPAAGSGSVGSLNCFSSYKPRPPMHVYHLDQLISHLKHNIVYSNIVLLVREWLRSQNLFTKHPELAAAVQAFSLQSSECFKALRLALLNLIRSHDALQTVLNLRKMAQDIAQLASNSGDSADPRVATIVHMMLMICRNIDLLYRSIDRALVTRDEPGIVSITDEALGQGVVPLLSLLNVDAMTTTMTAVAAESMVAAADEKKSRVQATRDGVQRVGGMMQVSGI